MNLDIEYQKCVKHATTIYNSGNVARKLCGRIESNMNASINQCISDNNRQQQELFQKCVNISTTDKQLDECVANNTIESSLKLCKAKCQIKALESLKTVSSL